MAVLSADVAGGEAIAWKVALDPMGQGHLSKEDRGAWSSWDRHPHLVLHRCIAPIHIGTTCHPQKPWDFIGNLHGRGGSQGGEDLPQPGLVQCSSKSPEKPSGFRSRHRRTQTAFPAPGARGIHGYLGGLQVDSRLQGFHWL